MVKAKVLANYLVKAYEEFTDSPFGNSELKLQKLMYFIQREALAIDGQKLIDEDFEGWVHGPVLPELRFFFDEESSDDEDVVEISEREKYIVSNVLDQYAQYAAWTLRDMSHNEECWKKSRIGLDDSERGNVIIPIDDIKLDANTVRLYDSNWGMYLDEFDDEPEEPNYLQ
ncbi:Panacea domain-containing protein [Psychrobacillus sp. FJAT-21963]|uniref:Panacea domain-containing protein n=1 Tax=Psychrobacillus sp. FJAT-21963 TaxID=1712028 RepID=UPI0006F4F0A2|nr:type II toxin-antitoxin system antitoxin SocA domain-containing protein [Psychrobacillus sp. FJAT-21963]KQL37112.1 hypothetical protein AN959_03465 [Psychrobacillus sp. FJAT-21963]